jgi:hypothetical protein
MARVKVNYSKEVDAVLNAWPQGPHERYCRRCDAPFISISKEHRVCARCGGYRRRQGARL